MVLFDGNDLSVFQFTGEFLDFLLVEADFTRFNGKNRVIFGLLGAIAGAITGAALADDNIAGLGGFASIQLNTQALRVGISA